MIVWLSSYPRSGNTFFRVLLNSVFEIKTYSIYGDKLDIGADKATSDVVGHAFLPQDYDLEKLRDEEAIYYIKTHDLPNQKILPEDKVIYLIRDGRESTLSYEKYTNTFVQSDKSLIDVINGNINFGSWGDHVQAWDPLSRPNTLLIKFEELTQDPTNQLESISHFLGAQPISNSIPTFEELQKINPKFFRSGKKDSWKDIYTKNELNIFWAKHYLQMKKYGYMNHVPSSDIQSRLKISVITPSLNSGKYIERAIESVLEQGYENFEHIITDGISTDDTIEILKKYPHLKGVSEKDSGQSNAMNKGFALSTGDIIVYLNADDYFLPGAFETVIPYFEQGEKFVVGDIEVVLLNGTSVRVSPKVTHEEILQHWIDWNFVEEDKVIASFPSNPVQYFYKREIQKQFPFNETNHFTMDVEFLMDASSQYDFCKINDILGVYVLYEDAKSIVASNNVEKYWIFENFSYIDKFIEKWNEEKKRSFKNEQQKGYLKRTAGLYRKEVSEEMAHKNEQLQIKQKLIEEKDVIIKERGKLYDVLEQKEKEMTHKDEQLKIKQKLIEEKNVIIKYRENQFEEMVHKSEQLYSLMGGIEKIVDSKTITNPLQKLNAYKHMLKVFFSLKKEISEENKNIIKEPITPIHTILKIHSNKGISGTEVANLMTIALINLDEENVEKVKNNFSKLEKLHPGLPKQYFIILPYLAEKILINDKYNSESYMYYCAAHAYIHTDYDKFILLLSKAAQQDYFSDLALYEYMELLLKNNDPLKILSIVTLEKIKNMSSVLMKKAYDVYMQAHYNNFDADTAYKKCLQLQRDFGSKYLSDSSVYYLHEAVLLDEKDNMDKALKLYKEAAESDGVLHGNSLGVFTVNEKEPFSFLIPEHTMIKSAQGKGVLHVAACDQLYFDKYALDFIGSLPSGKRIHILIINPDSDKDNRHILEKFKNVGVSYVNYDGKHLKSFYAFCRFFYIGEIAGLYQTSIIVSDIDLIWMNESTELLLPKEFEYSAIARTENKIHYRWNKITAFILACNNSIAAIKLQEAAREYWGNRFLNENNIWWIDQNFTYDFFKDKKFKNIYQKIKVRISKK